MASVLDSAPARVAILAKKAWPLVVSAGVLAMGLRAMEDGVLGIG